ncbi:MAG: TetR family transcriptional regulator [Actinobacteria bacterium HGW-Actinobacteria-4]|nr:MAG: TetR family transcriptional regulator [Actinobacteria bacterium HGW-Actinobacteria-4]
MAISEDRTAKSRVRDAAIVRFANHGIGPTNIKDIAADAGVSSALVIHHFGSKDGLRDECDKYVAARIRERKIAAMEAGTSLDPLEAFRAQGDIQPLFRYLARTLADNSPHVAALVDELVEDAIAYSQTGIDNGMLTPTDNPRERAIVLTLWSLGSIVLHDHAKRLMGVDLVDGTPEQLTTWALAGADILGRGVIDPDFYAKYLAHPSGDSGVEATRPDPPAGPST